MPKGYWVTTYRSIKDPDKLAAHAKLAPVALAPFGAKYIVRGAAVAASETGIKQRVVISVFDNVSQAIAAHDSPAYQAAVKVLGDGAPAIRILIAVLSQLALRRWRGVAQSEAIQTDRCNR